MTYSFVGHNHSAKPCSRKPIKSTSRHDQGPRGIDVAFSPDGKVWTAAAGNPVIPGYNSDTGNSVFWDEKRSMYRAYVRLRQSDGFRTVGLTESPDFLTWSEPRTVYAPSPEDRQRRWNFYGLSVTPYEGIYLGLVWIYPGKPESDSASSDTPATWQELVISRDGEHWQRVFFGQPFLPLGPKGSFDHRMIRTASSFTVLPGQIVLMYSGSTDGHGAAAKWDIGQSTLRSDGFVALKANDAIASLVTHPLSFESGTLLVNANVEPSGFLKAELVDESGKVMAGYSLAECQGVTGDQLHAPLTWNTHAKLPASQHLQLRFELRNARLYSFQIAPN